MPCLKIKEHASFAARGRLHNRKMRLNRVSDEKIGILLVAFNEAGRIEKRIEDLKGINKPNGKTTILIIDNGSSDKTSKVLHEIENDEGLKEKYRVLIDQIDDNRGYATAFNKGIKMLKDEKIDIVVTLSLKSKPDKEWLCQIKKAAFDNVGSLSFSGIELHCCKHEIVQVAGHCQEKSGALRVWGYGKKKKECFENKSFEPFCACVVNAAFRMELFERIGLIDERYSQYYTCSDIGWRARIMIPEFECKFIPSAVSYLKERHSGFEIERRKNSIKRRERDCVITLLKYVPEHELDDALLQFHSRTRRSCIPRSLRKQIVDEVVENRNEWITGIYIKLKDKEKEKMEVWKKWVVPKCSCKFLTRHNSG